MGFTDSLKKAAVPFGGGFAGDLFSGGSTPTVDLGPFSKARQESAEKQRGLITGAYGKLPQFTKQFTARRGEALGEADARRRAISGKFLQDIGAGQDALSTSQFNQAKQQILGEIPELQRAAREGAAATGGLKRGAAAMAVQAPVQQAQEQLGGVAGDIAIQAQQARQNALSQVFQGDQGFELQKLGIDMDTAQQLLDMGRGDILDEAMKLVGVEEGLASDLINLGQSQMESNLASKLATEQRKSSLIGALLGAGGQIGGGFAGRA